MIPKRATASQNIVMIGSTASLDRLGSETSLPFSFKVVEIEEPILIDYQTRSHDRRGLKDTPTNI